VWEALRGPAESGVRGEFSRASSTTTYVTQKSPFGVTKHGKKYEEGGGRNRVSEYSKRQAADRQAVNPPAADRRGDDRQGS
jgi:hypothetical protein